MDDGADAVVWLLVLVFLGVFIAAAWMLWKIAEGIYEHPAVLFLLALLVTAPIWLPPVLAAWVVLVLARNWVVYLWQHVSEGNEGFFLVFWVTALPMFIAAGWLGIGYWVWFLSQLVPHLPAFATLYRLYPAWPDVFLAYMVVSLPMLVGAYFYLHFNRPPKHPNWAYFIAAEERMKFDTKLTFLRIKTGLRLIAGR